MPTLQSIQIGMPQDLPSDPSSPLGTQPWSTGFFKTPVAGPVHVGPAGLVGDGQADLVNHGGEDKAICVYASEHFEYWREFVRRQDFAAGAFGENFTVAGLLETDVCIGDVWTIGDAQFEVTQPRQPCWKLARRWNLKQLTPEVRRTGKTGWYLRVLTSGDVRSAMEIAVHPKTNNRQSTWTIAAANDVHYGRDTDQDRKTELAELPALSKSWRDMLTR